MQTKHRSIRNVIRLLLLGILLAAQTLSFAHEVTHLSGDETELCEMCRIQGNSPAITNLDQDEFPLSLNASHPPQFNNNLDGACRVAGFRSRAPPPIPLIVQ
jgi:hypothetical protein